MFTDEVSQKGAKDMSQKNMEVMLSMEDKAEAEELTAFLQSVNITKITWNTGANTVTVKVTDGEQTKTYTVTVTKE